LLAQSSNRSHGMPLINPAPSPESLSAPQPPRCSMHPRAVSASRTMLNEGTFFKFATNPTPQAPRSDKISFKSAACCVGFCGAGGASRRATPPSTARAEEATTQLGLAPAGAPRARSLERRAAAALPASRSVGAARGSGRSAAAVVGAARGSVAMALVALALDCGAATRSAIRSGGASPARTALRSTHQPTPPPPPAAPKLKTDRRTHTARRARRCDIARAGGGGCGGRGPARARGSRQRRGSCGEEGAGRTG